MLERRNFYIDGKWVPPSQSNDFAVIDPSTEEVCATLSLGSQADTDAAVEAAQRAFQTWSLSSKKERVDLCKKILSIYKRRVDEMAHAISIEMGAPIDMALSQQASAGISHIQTFLDVFENFEFVRMLGEHAPHDRIIYEPIGVCGLITPWNWPMNQVTLKVIPAMLTGCTILLKPSEIAPLSSYLFAEILDEAGVPKGVFNLVNGDGQGVGQQMALHNGIDMISFTGSTRAGKSISKNAAETLKRVHLELGGKGANIIFSDADDKAVERGVRHCYNNTGQSCNAPTRMLVERKSYAQAVEAAKSITDAIDIDIASKSGNHMGPVVSEIQFNKIQDLIQVGIDEGARLVVGGTGRPKSFRKGFFVRPTVFADVSNNMRIAQEEIFGPVLSIIPFDTEEEAIKIANDTPYGLTNYVQSVDKERCLRVSKQLRSGMVEINGTSRAAGSPFGGMKASGNGREGGVWGLEDFMEVKSVSGWKKN